VAKSAEAFRSISEAAAEVGVPQHVLRFWETKFGFVSPVKRAGGRRFYRPEDIEILKGVRRLLHEEGLTLKGVARLHKAQGIKRILGKEALETAPDTPDPMIQPGLRANRSAPAGLSSDQRQRLAEVLRDIEAAQTRLEAALSR
jgi:DNA-binding transcriptional MerR regulator